MSEEKWAIITGCRRRHGNGNNPCRSRSRLPYYYGLLSSVQSGTDTARLVNETGNVNMEVMAVDLSSMASTASFAVGLWSVISPFPC